MHTIDNKYIFQDTKININYNYFIGHSHKQFLIKIVDYKSKGRINKRIVVEIDTGNN